MRELGQFTGRLGEGLRQALVPGERDRRKAQDFFDRFQTIKSELAELGSSFSLSGHRPSIHSNHWVTTVQLAAPKINHTQIMELIGRSGIQIPDQEPLNRTRENTIGMLAMQGLTSMEHIEREVNQTKIDLFIGKIGKDLQEKYRDLPDIEPEKS